MSQCVKLDCCALPEEIYLYVRVLYLGLENTSKGPKQSAALSLGSGAMASLKMGKMREGKTPKVDFLERRNHSCTRIQF